MACWIVLETQGKGVPPVRIDVELSQLRLDVRSSYKQLSKTLPIFQAEIDRKTGKSTGTVLDPTLERIGNV